MPVTFSHCLLLHILKTEAADASLTYPFSFCGSFCLLGIATFLRHIRLICQDLVSQFCVVLEFWAEQQRPVNTQCLVVLFLWWALSVPALCLCSEPGCCVTQKNWHLFSLKKWARIYGGCCWKLYSKLQLSALQPLVRNGLQAVLMNAWVKAKTDCKWTARGSSAFHEVSLFTGDRWKLLPSLGERLV